MIFGLDKQGVKINFSMINKKIQSSYGENFNLDLLKTRLLEKKKNWINDLTPLLSTLPPSFDKISQNVIDLIEKTMN